MRILIVLIITFLFYNQLYSDDVKIEYKNPDNVFTNFFSFKINSNVKFLLKEIQFRNNNKSEKRYKYNKYLNNNLFKISLAELSSGFYQIWIIGETNNHYYRKEFEVLLLNVKQKQNSENNTAEICYELFIKNKFDMQHYKYNKFSNWVDNFLLSAVKNQYHHPVINMVLTDYFYANNNYTHSIKKFNETIYYLLKYNKYKKDKILRKLMDLKQKKYFYKKVSEKSYIREWIKAKIIIFFTLNNISTFNKTKQFKLAMSEFFKTTEYIFTIHSLCINFKSIIMEAPTQSFIISTIINNYSGLIVENIKENKINNAIKILNVIMNIINIVNDNKIKIPMFELRKEAFYSWRAYLEYLRRNEKKMRKYLEIGEKKTKINYFLQAHLYYDRGKYDDSVKYLKKCLVPDAFVLSSPLNPKIRFFLSRGNI